VFRAADLKEGDMGIRRSLARSITVVALAVTLPLGAAVASGGALTSSAGAASGGLPAGLQPTNVNVTNDPGSFYGDTQIAVNPKNPNNLVLSTGAALPGGSGFLGFGETVKVYTSFDRGKTWTKAFDSPPPSGIPLYDTLNSHGTASLTVGPDGTFYLSYLALSICPTCVPYGLRGTVLVTKSIDGGLTWSASVFTGNQLDHPRLTTDLSSGVVYLAGGDKATFFPSPTSTADPTTAVGVIRDRITRTSTNGVTWSDPRPWVCASLTVPCNGFVQHNTTAEAYLSAARGVLVGAYRSDDASLCTPLINCIVFQTSADGGVTWTRHLVQVRPDASSFSTPLVAADPSGPRRFTLAVLNNGTSGDNYDPATEILVYRTEDSGATWTGPTIVTEDPSKTHQQAWMAYSPSGILGLAWRTNEPVGTGPEYPQNTWAAISYDGGVTFSDPLKVSLDTSPASPANAMPQARFLFDGVDCCSSIAVSDKAHMAYVGWTNFGSGPAGTSGLGQAYFSAIKLQTFTFHQNGS
jgi:hypothetical protein